MTLRTIIILVIIICGSAAEVVAQEKNLPTFRNVGKDTASNTLQKYLLERFRKEFMDSFSKTCGKYYDEVTFTVDSNLTISNIKFLGPPSTMTRFIEMSLKDSKVRWERPFNIQKRNFILVLPIYFYFFTSCKEDGTSDFIYYKKPGIRKDFKKVNGLLVESYKDRSIQLAEIKFVGAIVCTPFDFSTQN